MESLGLLEFAFAAGVLVLAYAVRGATGFGAPMIAVPLLALVMPLKVLVPAIVVLTMLSAFGHLWQDWSRIHWKELRRLVPPSTVGVLVGLYLLHAADVRLLLKGFGGFVISYACFSLATASRPMRLPERALGPASLLFGGAAGLMGAAFGAAAGPFYVVYLNSCGLERDVFRVTVSTILTILAVLVIAGYLRLGILDSGTMALVGAGLPLMVLGTVLGHRIARWLNPRWFSVAVSLLLVVSGIGLMFK